MAHDRTGPKDHYNVLGVSSTASDAELRRAYKVLALRYHPDKNPGNVEEATKQFKLVAEAYSVLKDPQARAAYDHDRSARDSEASEAAYSFEKAADLFHDVFGFELVGTLSQAARGIARAPGTVLAAAAKRVPEIPGVRSAVAAGCESMVTQVELDLDAQIQHLATLDVRVDEALCRFLAHDEACKRAELKRRNELNSSSQRLRTEAIRLCCCVVACGIAVYLAVFAFLPALAAPTVLFLHRTLKFGVRKVQLGELQATVAASEREAKADLQESLRVARESLDKQRIRAAGVREELARLRSQKADVEQSGPSFGDAVMVSSHLVGQVVSGAMRAVLRKGTTTVLCD